MTQNAAEIDLLDLVLGIKRVARHVVEQALTVLPGDVA
jgi:hypothetical protein